jgi:TonB family protein
LKKEKREDTFIKHPYYKGGIKAMNELIYGNLKYPKEAAAKKLEGIVILKYDINHLGHVIDAKVVKSLGSGCDEEAIRVVKMLVFEVPKNPRKLKITFHKDIHIHFKLAADKDTRPVPPSVPQQTSSLNVTYTILPTTAEEKIEPVSKTEAQVYTYSIKIN